MNLGGFHALGFGWLALLAGPLILFYFLKLKRPRLEVPSLVLWRQVLQDHRVNSPFQRFKRNLLLLLQLLLLALVVLAVMQPFWRGRAAGLRRLPVLIDNSASMGALDRPGGATRLEEAKRRVRTIIDGLVGGQQLCLISFGNTARKRTGFTDNKRVLREALDQIEVENVASDFEDALRLAQALGRAEPFDEVLLFSDGNLPERANFDLAFKLNYQRLAPAGPNLGITALSARRAVDGGWDVFAQIESSTNADGTALLELTRDGETIGSERLTLGRGRAERMVFRVSGEKAVNLRAQLKPDDFDSLAADNVAYLDLPATRPLRVFAPQTLASYRRALLGLSGLAVWPRAAGDNGGGVFDLVISDRAEDQSLTARTRLWIGLAPPELQRLVVVETNGTQVVDWRRDAPLLRHVELGDLIVLDQPRLAAGTGEGDLENLGYEVLVHGQRGPLVVQKQDGEGLTMALLFHSDRSTLPYRVGFPVLVANAVQAALDQAGLAEVRGSRSLLSASETSLASVDQIQFNERLSVAAAAVPLKSDRALWKPLALLALFVLLVEWWYFQRRPGRSR